MKRTNGRREKGGQGDERKLEIDTRYYSDRIRLAVGTDMTGRILPSTCIYIRALGSSFDISHVSP